MNIIVLKKLKKEDYIDLKAYKPIIFLSTLGKILKTIIAKYLSNYTEENNFLFTE